LADGVAHVWRDGAEPLVAVVVDLTVARLDEERAVAKDEVLQRLLAAAHNDCGRRGAVTGGDLRA
jgi:hypothetical protein